MKLAIITTHPIQYNAPLFKLLVKRNNIILKIFYTWDNRIENFDKEFGKSIEWDIPLLEGYNYSFLKNTANEPGPYHFFGIKNPSLISEIKKYIPDAILVIGWSFKSHLKVMRYFYGRTPILFRGDSHLLDEKRDLKTFFRRFFLKWVYKNIDYALYVGKHNKDYYIKHGLKEKQLIHAPHAIDNERFSNYETSKQPEWIKKLKIKDKTVILFIGKFNKKKNPEILIDLAEKKLAEKKLHFLFVGSGELEERLKKRGENLSNVSFIGFQNQSIIPLIYRLGSIMVLPSSGPGETWGLSVNESLASGTPVLVSGKVGCTVDIVKEGYNGYIFKADDFNDFNNKFEKTLLLVQQTNAQILKERCIESVKKFSFDAIASALEKIILKLSLGK